MSCCVILPWSIKRIFHDVYLLCFQIDSVEYEYKYAISTGGVENGPPFEGQGYDPSGTEVTVAIQR